MAEIFRPPFGDPHYAERTRLLKGFKESDNPFLQGVYRFSMKNRHNPAVVRETIHAVTLAVSESINDGKPRESALVPTRQTPTLNDLKELLPDDDLRGTVIPFPVHSGDIQAVDFDTHDHLTALLTDGVADNEVFPFSKGGGNIESIGSETHGEASHLLNSPA